MDIKVKSLLGICMKAGKLKAGESSVEKALQSGSAELIIISEDASENTKNKFQNKSFYYKVPLRVYGSRAEISQAIGKHNKVTLAVIDKGLSELVKSAIDG